MDHAKIDRALRLLLLLSGQRRYSCPELANKFEITERTVLRYLQSFRQCGFVVLCAEGRYHLQTNTPQFKSLQKLMHFSEDEACILYQTLAQIEGSSPVKERLLRKLHVLYDFQVLQKQDGDTLQLIAQLRDAMDARQQLVLKDYRSSNSGQVGDRLVEAFDFLPDYQGFWAYEPASQAVKQFRLQRLGSINANGSGWRHTENHRLPFCDAFGMAAPEAVDSISLRLSLKACNLLREEYPRAVEYLAEDGSAYCITLPVASYYGVGRFVMGLPGHVQVMGSEGFKKFLNEEEKRREW